MASVPLCEGVVVVDEAVGVVGPRDLRKVRSAAAASETRGRWG